MTCNNPKLDLVNINAYIKFGGNLLICSQDQADRAGHEDPREDCRWSHKTGGVY